MNNAAIPTQALLPLHIDSTMMSCFRSCPRKFYNEFVLGLRSGKSIDLHAGGAFSAALERFYRAYWTEATGMPPSAALAHSTNEALRTFMQYWGNFESNKPNSPKTRESLWAAFENYIAQYPPASDHIQPYFSEGKPTFEFSFAIPLEPAANPHRIMDDYGEVYLDDHHAHETAFPLHPSGQPFVFAGRPDLLGHWNGKTVIRDEKTSARLDSNWSEQWDLRSQFMGYVWAAQHSGLKCDTVAVRGIIITKTMIRQVEAFKTYSEYDVSRWFEQLRRDLWRIRRCWDDQYWDYNFGETCTQYGSCPYMGMCKSRTPENWYSQFEVNRWNPLNRNPIASEPSESATSSTHESFQSEKSSSTQTGSSLAVGS